jgi:hypothetical protein
LAVSYMSCAVKDECFEIPERGICQMNEDKNAYEVCKVNR